MHFNKNALTFEKEICRSPNFNDIEIWDSRGNSGLLGVRPSGLVGSCQHFGDNGVTAHKTTTEPPLLLPGIWRLYKIWCFRQQDDQSYQYGVNSQLFYTVSASNIKNWTETKQTQFRNVENSVLTRLVAEEEFIASIYSSFIIITALRNQIGQNYWSLISSLAYFASSNTKLSVQVQDSGSYM